MKINWQNLRPKIKLDRLAYYALIGAVVIIVGSYATWRLIALFAPSQDNSAGGTTVVSKVSDHSLAANGDKLLLPNSLVDPTKPFYDDDINSGPTPFLTSNTDSYSLFRIQGEVQYK